MSALLFAALPHCVNADLGGSYAADDPFLWAQLIVRGKIVDVEESATTLDSLGVKAYGPPMVVGIENVRLRVIEILKGSAAGETLTASFRDSLHRPYPRPFKVGDEIIVALDRDILSGRYQLSNYCGLVVRDGDLWKHPDPVKFRYSVDSPTLTYPQVRNRIESTSIDELSQSADLVVVGTLKEIERVGDDECWSLELSSVLKGECGESKLKFCVRVRGGSRTMQVPEGAVSGTEWLIILQRSGGRVQPLSGKNGMLLFDGEGVLYDLSMPLPTSRSRVLSRFAD